MAIVSAEQVTRQHGLLVVEWIGLTPDDEGSAYEAPAGYDLECVQVTGSAGGGTLGIQASNKADHSGMVDITDTASTSNWLFPINDARALAVRPAVTGGTGTDVNFHALFRQRR